MAQVKILLSLFISIGKVSLSMWGAQLQSLRAIVCLYLLRVTIQFISMNWRDIYFTV